MKKGIECDSFLQAYSNYAKTESTKILSDRTRKIQKHAKPTSNTTKNLEMNVHIFQFLGETRNSSKTLKTRYLESIKL